MRWNLGLKRQLLLGMTALMLLFVTTTLLALWQLNTMSAQLQRVVEHDAPKAALAHQLLAALLDVGMQERTLLPLTDSEDLKVQYATLQNALGHYRAVEQQLTALAADGSAGALGAQLATIRRERAQAEPVHARAMELVVNGAGAEAGLTLLLQVERADASWRKSIATIVDQVGASNQAIYQHDQLRSSQARQLLMCALALAIGSGTLLALKLARHVTLPVAHATSVASAIAAGDLTSRVTQHRRDELGRLLGAVGAMQDKLRHIVSNLRHSAAAIEDASCQVADGSTALSRGTALAASALQTTTASLHTLADTVQASAESARRASACTQEVRTKAEQGNLVMVRVQDSMRKVDQATRKIDGIVGMISEIAFQTNILALNAAVEAARAGPQGRGFAVVAGEVRTLAQRAAQAAAQISDLSREASGSISDSNSQVQHAAAMAIVLMDQADIVATLVADVSATATSQSDALHGIQQAMARLDGVTRQNADISAAAVGTAAALAHQSHELIRMVSMFRVDAASTASATTEAVALQFASGSATN